MIPLHRFGVVLRDALAGLVEHAQVELRGRIALLGGFAKPFGGQAIFPRDAVAVEVAEAEVALRHGVVLFRRAAIPLDRLLVILAHPLGSLVADAQIALCLRIAVLGGFPHLIKRLPRAPVGCHAICWVNLKSRPRSTTAVQQGE